MDKKEIAWLFEVFGIDEEEIEETLNLWLRVEVILSLLNMRGEKSAADIVKEGRLLLNELVPIEGEE